MLDARVMYLCVEACGTLFLQVATVQDVAVHPDYQGFGIGRRLLCDLTYQIHRLGICEVSVATPAALTDYFRACGFEYDQDETIPMWLPTPVQPNSLSFRKTLMKQLESKL